MTETEKKEYLEEIKNNLTVDQIYHLLVDLGGEPQLYEPTVIISRTICHNPPGQGSFKLYYYDNTKLFKCYTQCDDTFDVFQLILKVKTLAKSRITYWSKEGVEETREWALPDALNYILSYFGIEGKNENFSEEQTNLPDNDYLFKKLKNQSLKTDKKTTVSLKKYDGFFLKNLPRPRILPWEREGITQEAMTAHGICFDPVHQGIVIPHYDINGDLVGIRERTLIKEQETYGKYRPAILNGQMFNHPLSFNLYNINVSKENIKAIKKAIVFEGEKSCLLYGSYFGVENDISVATCGSNLINYQFELLTSLGVSEIIIAFDRQYKEVHDEEWKQWSEKLKHIHDKYGNMVQISYILDFEHNLGYKDSPIDKGPDIFIKLLKERVSYGKRQT